MTIILFIFCLLLSVISLQLFFKLQRTKKQMLRSENQYLYDNNRFKEEQAKQILDAQKSDDRPLIFLPAEAAKNRNRALKDW